MTTVRRLRGCTVVAAGFAAVSVVLARQAPAPQTVFRSGTDLVPIDVHVVDRKGQPVTDLKAEDFTVLENGVKQEIRQFATESLTAHAPTSDTPTRHIPGAPIEPQDRRLFLILLGRGRLQGPSKGLDALLTFVRTRLMPQDLVAVMAWNRATDFTANHEKVAAVIERFIPRHPAIETELAARYSGLAALYLGGGRLPANIQAMIDDVFNVPDAGTRTVLPGAVAAGAEAHAADEADQLRRKSEIEAGTAAFRQFNNSDRALADLMSLTPDTTFGTNFDDYISLSRQSLQDYGNLAAGVEYLRFLQGEKHLIFVTEQGTYLPSANDDRNLAAAAADARVAIDTLQTGGVAVSVDNHGQIMNTPINGFALSALRTYSDRTGGQMSVSERAIDAIDRIVNATEFGYVLGYAPAKAAFDDKYRTIDVKVARKNVTVFFRHGYFARPDRDFDPRRAIATTRLVAAANQPIEIGDLRLAAKVTDVRIGLGRGVHLDVQVAADHMVFAKTPTGALAALSVAVICTDSYGTSVGELWRELDVTVPLADFDQVRQTGLKVPLDVPVSGRPVNVKLIVYDYGSDRLGSKMIQH